MAKKAIVSRCPVCDSEMVITELGCSSCGTAVRGRFDVPLLCRLPDELYQFLLVFIKNQGVIRDVEKELGVSYPTVRSRLAAVLAALGFGGGVAAKDRARVIELLEQGAITAEEAERLLRGEAIPQKGEEDG